MPRMNQLANMSRKCKCIHYFSIKLHSPKSMNELIFTLYCGFFKYSRFEEEFRNNSEIYKDKKKYLHHLELFTVSLESAENWRQISAGNDLYRECPGDQMINWKDRGYSTILYVLMVSMLIFIKKNKKQTIFEMHYIKIIFAQKRVPNPEQELPVMKNTILNTTVMSIDYLQNEEGGPPILITTTNGQLYKADHVIVTVSLGVLKEKHKTLFMPALPDYKAETIEVSFDTKSCDT